MMKNITATFLSIALLLALASCQGKESAQNTTAQEEQKPAIAQSLPADKVEQGRPETARQEEQPPEAAGQITQAAQPADIQTTEITGTVVVGDAGVVIQNDAGEYGVTGRDISGMAGKTVSIIGTLEEAEGRSTIQVISVVEVE